jgi:hypothetical protein
VNESNPNRGGTAVAEGPPQRAGIRAYEQASPFQTVVASWPGTLPPQEYRRNLNEACFRVAANNPAQIADRIAEELKRHGQGYPHGLLQQIAQQIVTSNALFYEHDDRCLAIRSQRHDDQVWVQVGHNQIQPAG